MIGFPLLLIPFAIYNIFVFLMPGVAFTSPIIDVRLMSGATWTPTFSDALLTFGMLLLLLEVIKASRPGARYLTDHLLSLIVFGAAVAEFLLLAPFGTSTFLLLTVLMGVEFLSGVSLGLRNRRRHKVAAEAPTFTQRGPEPVLANPPEPSFDRIPESPKTPEPPKAAEPVFSSPDPVPEPAAEPEPAPRPVPSLAVIRTSPENPPAVEPPAGDRPASERSVAQWSVSDLVKDSVPPQQPGPPPKP